jgi:hypothetical protein
MQQCMLMKEAVSAHSCADNIKNIVIGSNCSCAPV